MNAPERECGAWTFALWARHAPRVHWSDLAHVLDAFPGKGKQCDLAGLVDRRRGWLSDKWIGEGAQ